jgi:hypothetical protein
VFICNIAKALLTIDGKKIYQKGTKHKGWKEKESTYEHDHLKQGLISVRTRCEVSKKHLVELKAVVMRRSC